MAIAAVQTSTQANATTSTPAASWPAATAAGSLLIAALYTKGTGVTVTPPSGWTLARSQAGAGETVWVYYTENAASQSGTVTFTLSASNHASLALAEYSGVVTASSIDQTASNSGTNTTAPTSGTTATTAQADELCVTVIGGTATSAVTFSAPTNGFSIKTQGVMGSTTNRSTSCFCERIVAATGAYGHGLAASANVVDYAGLVATFKAAAGGGGFSPKSRRTLGPRAGKRGAA